MAHILKSRVAESTTTTGTDPVALAGALVGHQTYSSVCSVGDTTEYVIYAADAYGFPSGEWEEGIGTYSGTNVLTRTTPKSGSSALPVNFSSGTKVVIMTPLGSRVGAIPRGGSANQVLSKATGNDHDLAWVDPSASITIDATPTDGSSNAVSSNGVFDALAGKADTGHNHSGVYDPAGTASSALSAHTGAADPHSQYVLESTVGAAGGVASLDGAGQVPAAQIPAIAVTELLGTVASQSAMLALSGQNGDWCIRSDTGTTWIITGSNPALLAGWTELVYPAAPVSSVAGRTGAVTITSSDLTDTTAAGRALLDDADAAAQRTTLGLGDAATKNVGTTTGTVAAGDHTHSGYETSIADAKVKGVTVLLPVTNDEITLFRARASMTITKLVAVGGGFTYTVRKAADRSATGTEVVTGGSTVTSTTTGDAVTSFNSASIAAGDYVWLKLTSVTGTPASFNLTMEYT